MSGWVTEHGFRFIPPVLILGPSKERPGEPEGERPVMALNNVLITGGTGFVGGEVQERWNDCVVWPRSADLADRDAVEETVSGLLGGSPFQGVLHLAAQASPSLSFEKPVHTWRVNLMGTVHLLEALSARGWRGRFLFVSTGAVYGGATGPITEETPVVVSSPYVASKLAAESAVLEWGRRTGTGCMVVRPFNHSGPGQSTHYFLPSMAEQISKLPETGGVIEVGNLKVHRDFLHVRDVVNAYRALLEQGRADQVYNLAGGTSWPLEEVLARLARKSGRDVSYRVSPHRFRPGNEEPLRVSLEKMKADTGWRVELGLEDLLSDIMEEWMGKACQEQR